jgi:CMP-N-acetylneuraminic acid synthetase
MIVGLITARGGSKRLPRKNLLPCAGRPLLAWTCMAAKASQLDRVVLSTDDEEIAGIGRDWGVEVPFLRPAELSGDSATSLAVAQHALQALDTAATPIEAIVLLQPTSPLRQATDIDNAVALFRSQRPTAVVTAFRLPDHLHPAKLMVTRDDAAYPFIDDLPAQSPHRAMADQRPSLLVRNGPAVLVSGAQTLTRGSLYGDRILVSEMPVDRSIDIDTAEDFAQAEAALRQMYPDEMPAR